MQSRASKDVADLLRCQTLTGFGAQPA